MILLVSACLLGECCKWDGGHNRSERVIALGQRHMLIPVCPEALGGLPTPRPPAEQRRDGRIVTDRGVDVTDAFVRGAKEAERICLAHRCGAAILKARSPSCGKGVVYDGSFTHTLAAGNGELVKLLLARGVPVYTEDENAQWPLSQ